jgi:lysozyme family protein
VIPSVAVDEVVNDLEGSEFTHDPEATRFGIVQSEYDRYRTRKGLPLRSVEFIEADEYNAIYGQNFWSPLKCSQMPDGVDFVLFQLGVNVGVGRAAKILQSVVGVDQDGDIGPQTIAAVKALPPKQVIDGLFEAQDAYYDAIADAHPDTLAQYRSGWHNRVEKAKVFLATGFTETQVVGGGAGLIVLVLVAVLLLFRSVKS